MQKAFYSEDIMEFKINHKWSRGSIQDIILDQNKFILSLEKEENILEYPKEILLINNLNSETLIKIMEENYSPNQRVEFYDESSNSWIEGTIKTRNNDFYIITYSTKIGLNNSKILYKNNIRPITQDKGLMKINLNHVKNFSLKNFENLSNPTKYAKKFIKKLLNLLNEKIYFIFLNNNFDLFIFMTEEENRNNTLVNNDVLNGLIEVAFNHFKDVDKANKKYLNK